MSYRPEGYPDLSPYLIVADLRTAIDFMLAAFGARALRMEEDEDGTPRHAEVRVGDGLVMAGQMAGGPEAHLHLYMADPDAAFARAVSAGGTVVEEMRDRDDGNRRGGVRAPCGTTWWLSRSGGGRA